MRKVNNQSVFVSCTMRTTSAKVIEKIVISGKGFADGTAGDMANPLFCVTFVPKHEECLPVVEKQAASKPSVQ